MIDQSLASLVTRERDDYFGRFFYNLGANGHVFHLFLRLPCVAKRYTGAAGRAVFAAPTVLWRPTVS
jgi:hypothetical protein